MKTIKSTERKEFIMRNFSTSREAILRYIAPVITLLCLMCVNLNAQCDFTSCPNQITTAVGGAGECEIEVVLILPSTSETCNLELSLDGVVVSTISSGASSIAQVFNVGTTEVLWVTEDGDECAYDVVVNDFDGAIGSVSCNDVVQVSLDDQCEAIITPDIVTEGGPYGCFDLFDVEIEGVVGNVITSPGTYIVTITTPEGNSCWGTVIVEDKTGPILECKDVATYCSQSTEPGATVCEYIIEENDNTDDDVEIAVSTMDPDAIIKSVHIELTIETERPSELSATLYSPNGTEVQLFESPGSETSPDGCLVGDMHVKFSDDGYQTQEELNNHCGEGILGILGSYNAIDLFSSFNGEDPNGDWIVEVVDEDDDTSFDITAILTIGTSVDTICFPVDVTGGYDTIGQNQFLVYGFGFCGPIELLYQDKIITEDCSSDLWETIERTWIGTDPSGNQSQCTQIIEVIRPSLDMMQYPHDWDGFDYGPLKCYYDFPVDENDHPHPDLTGYPVFPSGFSCPNIQQTYEDLRIDICQTSYKLIRTWSLLDWCTGDVLTETQIIKVVDDTPPYFSCPMEDETEYYIAGTYDCYLDFDVPAPTLDSLHLECSPSSWTVEWKAFVGHPENCVEPSDIQYTKSGVEVDQMNNVTIEDLPKGCVWLKYIMEDECGNFWEEVCKIHILDGTPPIAVCIEQTVASIGANGCVKVFAESFDNGSHDNCSEVTFEVRRMFPIEDLFGPYVEFCCADIENNPHMVQFKVTDKSGQENICMIEVTVQDKLPPILTCPDDVEIDCSDWDRHPDNLGWPDLVDNNLDCYDPEITWTDTPDLGQCGVGHINRRFRVVDTTNPTLVGTCIQRIWIYDYDPFYVDEDEDWPHDHEVTECNGDLSPENLPEGYDFPDLDDDECSLTAYSYKDQVFEFVPGACAKILRTWTVLDWCQYEENWPVEDPNQNGFQDGIWEHTQIIKLNNTVGPEFACASDTVFIAGYGLCEQEINYAKTATDDCTPEEDLVWFYEIDLFNDNSYDVFGNTRNAQGILPFGCHKIKWKVEDFCGNITRCEEIICIEDKKKPTPYCYSSISTVVMNSNGEIQIWASDFDLGSQDNCGDVYVSFSPDIDSTYSTFDCDDVPNGVEAEIEIQMWVTDYAGNQDFCTITLVLQDNEGDACEDNNSARVFVSGTVRTEDNRTVESATVNIASEQAGFPDSELSLSNGSYRFDNLPMNQDYTLSSTRGKDYLNGVSTLDLVLVQKHVLGIEVFDSPYKVIAADIDGNKSVSAVDLVNLRKLILGVFVELPNNQPSWKFVDADQDFADITSPWPILEHIRLSNVSSNMYNQDLIAVKMGDVTYNATSSNLGGLEVAENRSGNEANFIIKQTEITKGTQDVAVYLEDLSDILGFQFTMNLNEGIEIEGLKSGQLEMTENNYSVSGNQGLISWSEANGFTVDAGSPLFYITVDAIDSNDFDLTINSDVLTAEIYDEYATVYDLNVITRNNENGGEFALMQNVPNPFSDDTEIRFYNPNSGNVTMTLTNLQGRTVNTITKYFDQGNHTINLSAADLPAGVLYYSMESGASRETMRMIVVK